MGNGNCAVIGCTNSSYRLKKWKSTVCLIHGTLYQTCVCVQPFKLFWFPSKLRNSEQRERWVYAMKREGKKKGTKWEPKESDRVCSEHFADGAPSFENPDPTLNLGYECKKKCERRALRKNLNIPQGKRLKTQASKFDASISVDNSCCSKNLAEQFNDVPCSEASMTDHDYSLSTSSITNTKTCIGCTYKDEMISSLRAKLKAQRIKLRKKVFCGDAKFTFLKIKSNAKMTFYTGLTSIDQFHAVFRLIQPCLSKVKYWRGPKRTTASKLRRYFSNQSKILSHKNEFLLTLMRLRLGLLNEDIADRFGISPTTCSNTFTTWIRLLSNLLGRALVNWLPREPIRQHLPESFKIIKGYSKCRVILDCAEVFIERPKSLHAQAVTWSDYKHHNTLKFLIGIAPTGYITFLSDCYGGRASDKYIVLDSGFLDLLERDDYVMADRGFQIKEDLLMKFCSLLVPPGARAKSQFTEKEVEKTKEVANLRIHVERAINRIKTFRILKSELPIKLLHNADDIIMTCAALCNLKDKLIR